jgi:hypothetical protein
LLLLLPSSVAAWTDVEGVVVTEMRQKQTAMLTIPATTVVVFDRRVNTLIIPLESLLRWQNVDFVSVRNFSGLLLLKLLFVERKSVASSTLFFFSL